MGLLDGFRFGSLVYPAAAHTSAGIRERKTSDGGAVNASVGASATERVSSRGGGAERATPNHLLPDYHGIARELFMRRMSGVRNSFVIAKRDFIHCQVLDDMVYVFFLLDGKEGVVKEQVDSFPSDQLIAQFRLIMT